MPLNKWLRTLADILIGLKSGTPTGYVEPSPAEKRYQEECEIGGATGGGAINDPPMVRKTWRF